MKFKIKKGDRIEVISGKDMGKTGKVVRVDRKHFRVTVEGVNLQKRHRKATADTPGGIDTREGAIHYSNVMLLDKSGKRTRIGSAFIDKDGVKTKIRIARTTGDPL